MTAVNFKLDIDADGIALVTWDAPGRSMNVIDLKMIEELSAIVEKVAGDAAIKGAVITSGKETFCAGADLTMLEVFSREFADTGEGAGRGDGGQAPASRRAASSRCSTGGSRPAASRGSRRSTAPRSAAASSFASPAITASPRTMPKTRVGLPEIKVGLFPGAGGTQRVARMMPPGDALQFLLKGDQIRLAQAKGDEAHRRGRAGRRSRQARPRTGSRPAARPRRRGTSRASGCPAGRSIPRPA